MEIGIFNNRESMNLELVIFIASIPLILALIAYRYYGWYNYVKNRKYSGNKLKKYADKMNGDKNDDNKKGL